MSTTATKTSRTLSFYTTGDGFTNLMRGFIEEGRFSAVYETLKEGGMNEHMIRSFFLFGLKFEGTTKLGGDLDVVEETEQFDLPDIYTSAIATCFAQFNQNSDFEDDEDYCYDDRIQPYQWLKALDKKDKYSYIKDFNVLTTILPMNLLSSMCGVRFLERMGYVVKRELGGEYEGNGVLLRDGTYVMCSYMGHQELYPILMQLGLASCGDWTKEEWTIHVTSGSMSGNMTNSFDHDYEQDSQPTEDQLQSLFRLKSDIQQEYGGYKPKSTVELLRCYNEIQQNHGGKYNNLTFLKKYYPWINTPAISKEKMEGKVCIRTSPKRSMAGLLNSKFEITEDSIKEIKKEYKAAIELLGEDGKHNELHYFYQEYLEGGNGVCHYWSDGKFKYAYSDNQGDVVKGVKTDKKLTKKVEAELKKIGKTLCEDLKNPVQLEFVVQKGKLFIVQLRLLTNNPSNTVGYKPLSAVLVYGKTFSTGSEWNSKDYYDISVDDILIVDSDAESKELIGKKALIVKSDVEFSHILALSKTLDIPSMFATGEFDVKKLKGKRLSFVAKNEDAWVTENKK